MSSPAAALSSALYAGQLRRELSERNREYARVHDNNGNDLMYFEIPMEKYLSYKPPTPAKEQ